MFKLYSLSFQIFLDIKNVELKKIFSETVNITCTTRPCAIFTNSNIYHLGDPILTIYTHAHFGKMHIMPKCSFHEFWAKWARNFFFNDCVKFTHILSIFYQIPIL